MILSGRRLLESEIATLNELIDQTPEEDVIDRKSLEDRKKEVEAALAALNPPYYEPARGRLTFRGKPTIKSQGVFADFAGSALDKYSSMVVALGADQSRELGSRGMIPNKEQFQLMVTGTAIGSFGFEIEEAPKETILFPELSPAKAAMEKANLIMELSAGASDDVIAEAIADTSTRAIEAVRAFLEVMEKYEAEFAIELDDKFIRFNDIEQIRHTRERLRPENISEWDEEFLGEFQGTIPARRLFQFLRMNPPEIIVGKIGPEIEDPIRINHMIEKPIKIKVHAKQVGTGRPTYRLNYIEELNKGGLADFL